MKLKRVFLLILAIIFSSLLSGCWDSVEINKRSIVLGIGLDKDQENKKEITHEIALPSQMVKGGGEEIKGGKGNATWDMTKSASMITQANNTMNEDIDRTMDLDHLQVLIIGSQIAKEGILDSIDFLFRNPETRRLTKVVYFDGRPIDVLKVEPKTIKSPAIFISNILDNKVSRSYTILKSIDLGKFGQDIRENFEFILPRIRLTNNEIGINGAAVFKDGKIVCDIEPNEIQTIEWIRGESDAGNIEVSDPQDISKKLIYEFSNGNSKLKPIFNGDKITFKLKLNIEGDIIEKENTNFSGTLDIPYIGGVEKTVEEKIKTDIISVYNKYEIEKKLDVLELKRKIKNYNNKFFEDNKDRLNDILAESNIDVLVTAKVRRIGSTR